MNSKFVDLYLDRESVPKDFSVTNTDGRIWLVDGKVKNWEGKCADVFSPILDSNGKRIKIGEYAMMTQEEALHAIEAAHKAYSQGLGEWPSMLPKDRIRCVERFLEELEASKKEIINLIMWEICKTKADATKEVDRSIEYIRDSIHALKSQENSNRDFVSNSGVLAQVRRVPLGTCLCLAPFNYPLNETYTTLFPALLMGNTVVLKTPRTGGLCHTPTVRIFQKCFPPGVVNIIHGSGRETLPPIMDSGKVDIFAFIGTSKAAVDLQKLHPNPHRLRVILGLDAKNPAIVCADADINVTVKECILGSLSFNGQRCTALKVIYVHESRAQEFIERFSAAVDNLKIGLPWQEGVAITPLPEPEKPSFLRELINDAVSKGAKIANQRGGQMDGTFVVPTVLYPVSKAMRAFNEEQFGPLIPVVPFKDFQEVIGYMIDSSFGQQASIFSQDPKSITPIMDILANQVSRVNVNCQCQRGPDILPFTGRKNSAHGTLSVTDALRTMSIRTIIATKVTTENQRIFSEIMDTKQSKYLRSEYLF